MKQLVLWFLMMTYASSTLSFICETDECAICNISNLGVVSCLACEYGYELNNSASCDQVSCSSSMFFDRVNGCQPCDSSCNTCVTGDNNGCTSCVDGYYKVQSSTNHLLSSCFKCPQLHCEQCDWLGYCSTCEDGYFLNSTTQDCELCSISNSLSCLSLSTVSTCISGYSVSDDFLTCEPDIDEESCPLGTYIDSNELCQDCTTYCIHCNAVDQCYVCEDLYYVASNGTCQQCPTNCSLCNSGGCTTCDSGYIVDNSGNCEIIQLSNLVSCQVGQYIDMSVDQCIQCDKTCAECDLLSGNCSKCWDQANYVVSQNNPMQCTKRCADGSYFDLSSSFSSSALEQLARIALHRQKISLSSSIDVSQATCTLSTAASCTTPGFLPSFCLICSSSTYNNQGTCVASCPAETYSMADLNTFQKRCFSCPAGCLVCTNSYTCSKCSDSYFLVNSACMNSGITTGSKGIGVLAAGHWMSACPEGTFLSGSACFPYLTCQKLKFNIETKTVICSQCLTDVASIFLPLISGYLDTDLPTSKIAHFGKCYEACPFTSLAQDSAYNASSGNDNTYCNTSCPFTKPYVTQTDGIISACEDAPSCATPELGRFCKISDPCSSGEYFSLEEIFELDFNYKQQVQTPDTFCKACPTGCAECTQNNKQILCTSCSTGFDTYSSFNIQDLTSYPFSSTSQSIFRTIQCIQQTTPPASTPCSDLVGYYYSSDFQDCEMCQELNASCTACPINSFLNVSTEKCIPFCAANQITMTDTLECYDKPSLSVAENYLTSIILVGTQTFNIATTSFNVDFHISSTTTHNINFISGKCYISEINQYCSSISPIIQPASSTTLVFSSPMVYSVLLKKLLSISSYTMKCSATLNFVERPTHIFTIYGQKSSIQHISVPVGSFTATPITANCLTLFTGNISNWKIALVQNFFEFSLFNYQISIVARNSLNLKVKQATFILKTITYAEDSSLYPTDNISLTQITTTFSTNLQNSIFNTAYLLLTVTPNLSQLSALVTSVKFPITYSFEKSDSPKNSQNILVSKFLETAVYDDNNVLQKAAMIALADETLLSRGALPFDQELQTYLPYQKQLSALSSISVPISCDSTVNCNGKGVCKKYNSNWYAMCQCNPGQAGEQCDWKRTQLENANETLRTYLEAILSDITLLDPEGSQPSASGFNISEMLTLLQVWSTARDTFSKEELLMLIEILKTNALNRDGESERVQQILDNTIDILRKVSLSSSQFLQYFKFISESISATSLQIMKKTVKDSKTLLSSGGAISPVVIDQSNFKGVLIHQSALQNAVLQNDLFFSVSLPNDTILKIPPALLSAGEYLEVILKPLDSLPSNVKVDPYELQVLLSNPLTITVRNLTDGTQQSVDAFLNSNPIYFELTYILPSTYLTAIKNVSCVFYNESTSQWNLTGLTKVNEQMTSSSYQSIGCNTTHLTSFSLSNIDYNSATILPVTSDPISDIIKTSQEFKMYFIITLIATGVVLLIIYTLSLICVKQTVVWLSFNSGYNNNEQTEYAKSIKDMLPAFISADFQSKNFEGKSNDEDEEHARDYHHHHQHEDDDGDANDDDDQDYNGKLSGTELKPSSKHPWKIPKNLTLKSLNVPPRPKVYLHCKTVKSNQVLPLSKSSSSTPQQLENMSLQNSQKVTLKYPQNFQTPLNSLIIEGSKQTTGQVPVLLSVASSEPHAEKNKIHSNLSLKNAADRKRRTTKKQIHKTQLEQQHQSYLKQQSQLSAPAAILQLQKPPSPNDNLSRISDVEPMKSHALSVDLFHDPSGLNQEGTIHNSYHQQQSSNSSDSNITPSLLENQDILTIMLPYLTIMSWKYSFERFLNFDRVLIQVIIISFVFFSSSYSITYLLSVSNAITTTSSSSSTSTTTVSSLNLSVKSMLASTGICLLAIELATWTLVVAISIQRFFVKELCCCFQKHKAILSHLWQLFMFILSFVIFSISAFFLIEFHSDLSSTKFYTWIVSSFASLIINSILEFLSLYGILKTNSICLLQIVKYKRFDF